MDANKFELYRLRGIIERLGLASTDLTAPAYDSKWVAKVKEDIDDIAIELESLMDDFTDIDRAKQIAITELSEPVAKKECEHEKVYASYVLASNPPQYPWICKKCGTQGRDMEAKVANTNEYGEVLNHFIQKVIIKEDK